MSNDTLPTVVDCAYFQPGVAAAFIRCQGDEVAIVETNTSLAVPLIFDALERLKKRPEDVRYVIVTHAHLDHAGGAGALLQQCVNATLLAHPKAARHLIDPSRLVASASAVYGAEAFKQLYGEILPIASDRVVAIEDSQRVSFGASQLNFFHTKGHATHHFVVQEADSGLIYTGDTFGIVYPALQGKGTLALISSSPTDFDAEEARKSVRRIQGLKPPHVCLTHFGCHANVDDIAQQLLECIDFSDQLVGQVSDLIEAEALELYFTQKLDHDVRRRAQSLQLNLTPPLNELLALDVKLNAQGLAHLVKKQRTA